MHPLLDKFVVFENDRAKTILNKISKNARGIVYVLDEQERLVGSITDGDSRKYFLNHEKLDYSAEEAMNKSVRSLNQKNERNAFDFIRDKHITSVPIVDDNRHILDICFFDGTKLGLRDNLPMSVVFFETCLGKGKTSSYFECEKSEVLKKTLNTLEEMGCKDFFQIHDSANSFETNTQIEVRNVNVTDLDSNIYLGTAGTVKPFYNRLGRDVLLFTDIGKTEGILYDKVYRHHIESGAVVTVLCHEETIKLPKKVLQVSKDFEMLGYKEPQKCSFITEVGQYIVNQSFWEKLDNTKYVNMPEAIQACIDAGDSIAVFQV